jgi:hypothetical protein
VVLPTAVLSDTEEYNGSTWTAGGSLNGARRFSNWSRNTNSSYSFGGLNPPATISNSRNIMVLLGHQFQV